MITSDEEEAQSFQPTEKGRSEIPNNKTGGPLGRNTLEKKGEVLRSKTDDTES